MAEGSQVVQVVCAVANGDGDWADVPRCVREAIVLALAGPQSQMAPHFNAAASSSLGGEAANRRQCSSWPEPRQEARVLASSLSEEMIQRGVQTFEDAAWVRDQAVRSFAQFHNSIEATREAVRHHLRSLWRTAIQLDPSLLRVIQQERRLGPRDEIPEDTIISGGTLRRMQQLEAMVDEIEGSVDALRWTSVRFAANFLSDEEKRAMGLDPANLRPEDVSLGYTPQRDTSPVHTSGQRPVNTGGSIPQALLDRQQKNCEQENTPEKISTPSGHKDDAMLSEMRRRYMNRIALLNEASMHHVADEVMARRHSSSSKNVSSHHRVASASNQSSLSSMM
ncbi:hypothetical protein BCY84_06230 [Trypanosoma cruzi cruzi]|uniref:Uncharacterized protein n=1 Tax=Trypanosoma cruzi TaxID=5693 RepID=A0A2V2V2U6_TRYCR|nr:hypothetical protein BCY84_06230 [Trypanosoma cruzi cruzi]PWU88723.1 hypothetical protein C4B63_69g53 [Trypanosoma cruzi]